jgi:hypothetical protein
MEWCWRFKVAKFYNSLFISPLVNISLFEGNNTLSLHCNVFKTFDVSNETSFINYMNYSYEMENKDGDVIGNVLLSPYVVP